MSEIVVQPPVSAVSASPHAFFAEHRDEVMAVLARVVDSGFYILGEEVRAFEREFAHALQFADAAGVANGTDALHLILRALGIGPGDLVATVSHTAVATVAAIQMAGAEPVFVDIERETYTVDPLSLERIMAEYRAIKAVIVVHLYGHPADMHRLCEIAAAHRIRVIEDCAQAHGARWQGEAVGTLGDAASFSFYPTKNMGALGDGGIVASRDAALVQRIRMLREYGWRERYISERAGINSRLDEVQAAILRVRLRYLRDGNRRRAEIARAYTHGLGGTGLQLPASKPEVEHVYHQYVIRDRDRDGLRKRLRARDVVTNIHYPVPVHRQPAYSGKYRMDPAGLPETEAAAREVLSLPIIPELTDEQVEHVTRALREVL